ncbi:periplasmic binding protein [Tupanvirus soda lake]|uniref:Periplasmic binding protein n=2 Tax=Tupanvirus TaxID=2094720 RepID=A0A6N1NL41_9VIRU|nr:periplasmic binding protein [Tupanvirus soda lake]QKU35314.1 periplasmic binding protein [Tupanvirus soda lake]
MCEYSNINADNLIVVLLPLTGPASSIGINLYNAMQLFLENERQRKKFLVLDTTSNPEIFVSLAEKYIALGVRIFIGGITSDEVVEWQKIIYPKYGKSILLLSPSSTSEINEMNSVIRIVPNDRYRVSSIRYFLFNSRTIQNVSEVGVLAINNTYGQSIINLARDIFDGIPEDNLIEYDPNNLETIRNSFARTDVKVWIIAAYNEFQEIVQISKEYPNVLLIFTEYGYDPQMQQAIIESGNIENILCNAYIGTTARIYFEITDIQRKYFAKFGQFASDYGLGMYSLARFFNEYLDVYNYNTIYRLIQRFRGLTGSIQLDEFGDRNDGIFMVVRLSLFEIPPTVQQYIWREISYNLIRFEIKVDGVIYNTSISTLLYLQNATRKFETPTFFDKVTVTNYHGHYFEYNNLTVDTVVNVSPFVIIFESERYYIEMINNDIFSDTTAVNRITKNSLVYTLIDDPIIKLPD